MSKEWTQEEIDALPVGPHYHVDVDQPGTDLPPKRVAYARPVRAKHYAGGDALAVTDSRGVVYMLGQWDDTGQWFKEPHG